MNKISSLILILLSVFLVILIVAGNHGLLRLRAINSELDELNQKNKVLESGIVALENKIFAIKNSSFVLEKNAREELGLSKPGEIVYIFPEGTQRRSPETALK